MLKAFRWLTVALVGLTFLTYLSPYINPVNAWPFAFLALLPPWLLGLNFVFLIAWAFRRKWYGLLPLGALLLGWGHLESTIGWKRPVSPVKEERSIRVLSFNAHTFLAVGEYNKPIQTATWIQLLDTYQPDIVCIQEFITGRRQRRFFDAAAEWGLSYTSKHNRSTLAILSRYPLSEQELDKFQTSGNGFQKVRVDLGDKSIVLFNVHLRSNKITMITDRILNNGDLKEKKTWNNIRAVAGRYRFSAQERAEQAVTIRRLIDQQKDPVIVCGDLNDTPHSYTYRILKGSLQDAFRDRGWGIGFTYSGKIPGLRIDYIFASDHFQFLAYQRGKKNFSDHYPIVGTIRY